MNIKQYQEICKLDPTGLTFDYSTAKILNIDTDKPMHTIVNKIQNALNIKKKDLKYKYWFNGRYWKVDKDILESTFDQWTRLELLISEEDNLSNFHKLLAIYFRPCNIFGKIEPFDLNKQDKIAEELLELPMEIANEMILFFYLNVIECMNYIKIAYLNKKNQEIYTLINEPLTQSTNTLDGVSQQLSYQEEIQ